MRQEGIQHRRERERGHASGKPLPPGRGTTRRRDVKDIGGPNNNFSWHATCKLYGTMKRTTFFWLSLLAFAGATSAQEDSLTEIRNTAHAYVRSLIPASAGETTITVAQLDNRLHLAPCAAKDLSAALPAGASLQARTTVGVSCAGPVAWRVFVPVNSESNIDVLVIAHAVNRDARLTE